MTISPNTLSPVWSVTIITKEDKAAGLARRREGRKQVGGFTGFLCENSVSFLSLSCSQLIAMLKEQKKNAAKGS